MEPLESLNDNTDDELQEYETGDTYEYVDGIGDEAKRELASLLSAWAEKYVKVRYFCCDGDAMEIVERAARRSV